VHAIEATGCNQQYAAAIIDDDEATANAALHVAEHVTSMHVPRRYPGEVMTGGFDRA
jgi:hypothetical protein